MESSELKACVTCAHYTDDPDAGFFCLCQHPDYMVELKDFIHGKIYKTPRVCALARRNENLCGKEARGWEEKPYFEPPPRISFRSWVREQFFGSGQ